MQKIYLLLFVLLYHLAPYAQPRPVECIKDTVVFADPGSCSRRVEKIDPYLLRDIPLKEVTYRLEGTTNGEGVGSASGTLFKAGTTTVTYTALRNKNYTCSFKVIVVAKDFITPAKDPLPDISLNCRDSLKTVPFAYYKCTDERIYATTSSRLSFPKAGQSIVVWRYYVHGLFIREQKQQVTVHDVFTPGNSQLPDLAGDCFVRVVKHPTGVFRCSGEEIIAKTTDPLEYKKAGTHTINWTYLYQNKIIYRQTQKVIVTPRVKLVPTTEVLKLITDTCSVTISQYPTAREVCSDSVITAIPLGLLKYETPGLHTLTWRYIYHKDTVEQKQQIKVIKGGFKPDVDSLKTIYASCSITITEKPTATNSCTKSKVTAINLDPLGYDRAGEYKLRWMYVYNKDTVIQVQQVHLRAGKLAPDRDSLGAVYGTCSVEVRKHPTATNCSGGPVTATPLDPLKYDKPGRYTIRWFYKDRQDTLTQYQQVIVEAGRLIVDSGSLSPINASCSVVVTKKPTVIYSCDQTPVTAKTSDPLKYDIPGTYYIRWSFIYKLDTVIRIQQVNVKAGSIAPDMDTLPLVYRTCSVEITKYPTAINCSGAPITAIPLDPIRYDKPGRYTIRWFYKDRQDSLTQYQQVIVETGRLIPDSNSLSPINASCSVVVTKKPTAMINCDQTVVTAKTSDPLKYDIPGTYYIRWSFIYKLDTVIRIQQVNVKAGSIAPNMDTLPLVYRTCSVEITKYPTAINCSGSPITATPLDPLKYDKPGRYTIRWFYKDRQDTLTQYQQVIVEAGRLIVDTGSLSPINASCSVVVTKKPTAIYSCDQTPVTAKTSDPLKYDIPGTYYIRWSFIYKLDTVIRIQQVNVKAGKMVPRMDTLPPVVGNCFAAVTTYPTATNCSGSVITAVALDTLKYDKPGHYTIRWLYKHNQDTLTQLQQVIVNRGKLIPDAENLPTISQGCIVEVATAPTATQTCTGQRVTGVALDPVKYDKPGSYRIRWRYIDNSDTVIQYQVVNVKEGGKPTFEIDSLPLIVGDCSVTIATIPTAINTCTGHRVQATTTDPRHYTRKGKYKIRWTYTINGDTLEQFQSVEVRLGQFLTPETETLPALTGSCSVTITKKPTARNNCSGKSSIGTTNDPLYYNKPGRYTITWVYNDDSSATITQQQEVIIEKSQRLAPNIAQLPELTGDCSVSVTRPTATNTCTGEVIAGSTTDPLIYTDPGEYFIQWKYYSSDVDSLVQTQKITIKSTNRIVPQVANLPGLEEFCSVTITDPPTAVNRCTGKIIKASTKDALIYNVPGEYVIEWIFKDNNDTLVQTQKIIVSNKLTMAEASLPDIQGECEIKIYQIPIAVNSCKKMIKATTKDPMIYSAPGTYTITWIFKDGDITFTQTQKVTVLKRELTVQVYPNPTKHEFMIYAKTCQRNEKLDLRMYDISGKLVEVRQVNVNQEVRFGSGYPASIYVAHIIWNEKRYVYKLIKSR